MDVWHRMSSLLMRRESHRDRARRLGTPRPFSPSDRGLLVTLRGVIRGAEVIAQSRVDRARISHWRADSEAELVLAEIDVRIRIDGMIGVVTGFRERCHFRGWVRQLGSGIAVVARGRLCQRDVKARAGYRHSGLCWCLRATGPSNTVDIAALRSPHYLPAAVVIDPTANVTPAHQGQMRAYSTV